MKVRVIIPHNREDIRREIDKIGTDKAGTDIMVPKGQFFWVKLYDVPLKGAVLLKQEMLSKGGEAAVPRDVGSLTCEKTDILLMGTLKQYRFLTKKLKQQPFSLKDYAMELEKALKKHISHHYMDRKNKKILDLREKSLPLGDRTLVMGILNVTPDSFSDGGYFFGMEKAIDHAKKMVDQGIDILDIGGESTRPQSEPISEEEELKRIEPILKELLGELEIPISIDTYKASVAERALEMGVHMVNDVWGLKADPEMAPVISSYKVPVCIMHNRKVAEYQDLITEVVGDLKESIDIALNAGIKEENIILDPGIGFGKTLEDNLEVMHHLEELVSLGYPVLLGTSRKSMIGKVLDLPAEERLEGTAATLTLGIAKGVDIVRVHDIEYMQRVVKMTDTMVRRPPYDII